MGRPKVVKFKISSGYLLFYALLNLSTCFETITEKLTHGQPSCSVLILKIADSRNLNGYKILMHRPKEWNQLF